MVVCKGLLWLCVWVCYDCVHGFVVVFCIGLLFVWVCWWCSGFCCSCVHWFVVEVCWRLFVLYS